MAIPYRDRNHRKFVLNLKAPVPKEMSAQEYVEMCKRCQLYTSRRRSSGLTPSAWVSAMHINSSHDYEYLNLQRHIPDKVMSRAKTISSEVRSLIKRIATKYEQL